MDCLTANPPGCDANVAMPSDVQNCVRRIETRCASYRQRTLPHRRAEQAPRLRQSLPVGGPPSGRMALFEPKAALLRKAPSCLRMCRTA
nr:hypothetical protein [Methylomarinum sp. Ch1-1]MDP4519547.1 hypothetical protein [Methylomarinum sp. Ch1-1]